MNGIKTPPSTLDMASFAHLVRSSDHFSRAHSLFSLLTTVCAVAWCLTGSCWAADKPASQVFHDPLDSLSEGPEGRFVGRGVAIADGKTGGGVHLPEKLERGFGYPLSVFPVDEGTLEFWVAPDGDPNSYETRHDLFGYHTHNSPWYKNHFSLFFGEVVNEKGGWGPGLFLAIGDKNVSEGSGSQGRTVKMTPVLDWRPGEWHHIAMTWRLNSETASEVLLYVDYEKAIEIKGIPIFQSKEDIAAVDGDPRNGFFWFGPPWGSERDVKFDEVKLYNKARSYGTR